MAKKILDKKEEGDLSVTITREAWGWKGQLSGNQYGNTVVFEKGQSRKMEDVWPIALNIWEKSREALIRSKGMSLR